MSDIFLRISNHFISKPYLVFFILSLLSLLTFGLDIFRHQTYNLSELFFLNEGIVKKSGYFSYAQDHKTILFFYTKFIVPVLEYGVAFIFLTLFSRFLAFILLYKLVINFLEKNIALLITSLFLLAYLMPSHGSAQNGLWGGTGFGFNPAVLSSLMTIAGMFCFIKKQHLVSGLCFSLSIFFQPLYGVTALGFLLLGFILIMFKDRRNTTWLNFSFGAMLIIFSIIYIASMNNNEEIQLSYSFLDWYHFISSSDYDDVQMLYVIRNYGYGFVPLFFAALLIAFKEEKKGDLELFTIGSIIIFLICIFIEVLHKNELFFGKISEIFLSLQLRRGVWIPALFSFVQVAKYLYPIKEEKLMDMLFIMLIFFGISTYIMPSIISVIILIVITSLRVKSRFSIFLLLLAAIMTILHFFSEDYNAFWQISLFYKTLIFTFLSCLLFKIGYSIKDYYHRLISTIILTFLILFSAQGFLSSRFINTSEVLFTDGFLGKTDIKEVSDYVQLFPYDEKANNCMNNSSALVTKSKIQSPITGPRRNWVPYFTLEELYGFRVPIYSRKAFEIAIKDLKLFFGEEVVNSFFNNSNYYKKTKGSKQEIHNYFLWEYNHISKARLQILNKKASLRFYLTEKNRDDLEEIIFCRGDRYYVYDLSLIN